MINMLFKQVTDTKASFIFSTQMHNVWTFTARGAHSLAHARVDSHILTLLYKIP